MFGNSNYTVSLFVDHVSTCEIQFACRQYDHSITYGTSLEGVIWLKIYICRREGEHE